METENAIKNRKTIKVLADTEWEVEKTDDQVNQQLSELMELALHAPFHYFSERKYRVDTPQNSLLPWRCYSLTSNGCRELAQVLKLNKVEAGKIMQMLHTADAMILVTWLPDTPETELPKNMLFEANIKNMEHLAAASAAIQNILLGATSKGIPNYWSSGGVLRDPSLFEYLEISKEEILLGALFLFPNDISKAELVYGANRKDSGTIEQFWRKLKVE